MEHDNAPVISDARMVNGGRSMSQWTKADELAHDQAQGLLTRKKLPRISATGCRYWKTVELGKAMTDSIRKHCWALVTRSVEQSVYKRTGIKPERSMSDAEIVAIGQRMLDAYPTDAFLEDLVGKLVGSYSKEIADRVDDIIQMVSWDDTEFNVKAADDLVQTVIDEEQDDLDAMFSEELEFLLDEHLAHEVQP